MVGHLRVLFDLTSQITGISDRVVRQLHLPVYPGTDVESSQSCSLVLHSRQSSFQFKIQALVIPADVLKYEAPAVVTSLVSHQVRNLHLANTRLDHMQ